MLTLFPTVVMMYIVVLMGPGPDSLSVSQTVVSRSRKGATMGVLGITCGVMTWVEIASLGLHLIIEKMAWLHTLIMMGGGLHFCWMGYQILRDVLKKEIVLTPVPQIELVESGRSFSKGLLTNLVNPKVTIYSGSVSSLFAGDNAGTIECWGVFALIIVETLVWFIAVANLSALSQARRGYQRLTKWIDGFAGVLFVGFGIHLIISH